MNFALAPAVAAKDAAGTEVMIHVDLPGRPVYAKVWRIQIGRVPYSSWIPMSTPTHPLIASWPRGSMAAITKYAWLRRLSSALGVCAHLRALGHNPSVWHLNEGHSSFSVLERVRELVQSGKSFAQARDQVRAATVFTTHTRSRPGTTLSA